ncbi:MAG: HAD hydrolase-like protein [Lentisphaeria bacterium]|nr:HAD hydrolase-like protein [Lentisphaeria bacterium]
MAPQLALYYVFLSKYVRQPQELNPKEKNMDYVSQLKNLPKEHDFFVGFDSDGCIFDTMEIKQKECFCPAFIKHFELQAASKYAREVWQFVNLYSKDRGCNRYLAIQKALRLISQWKVFEERGIKLRASIPALDAWVKEESKLGIPALKRKVADSKNEDLSKILDWSMEVDARILDLVYGVPPFPKVRESLQKVHAKADAIVVSQTPIEALQREWKEHNIDQFVNFIAGQEAGTKTEHLQLAAKDRYPGDRILMVGDAPGDYKAAKANQALFFPIIPGEEEKYWQEFLDQGIKRFFAGDYAGSYQEQLLAEFDKALPENPSW